MIPDFGLGDVLPPFGGADVVGAVQPRSPYLSSMSEFVERFGTSPERREILRGLLDFRSHLRQSGFTEGFQWLDGSFVENCESVKGRAPGDVDVVSVLYRPDVHADDDAWGVFIEDRADTIFDSQHCKNTYRCDAYYIDLDVDPHSVAEQTAYWFGLFSHQRDTFRWKGLVQIPIDSDDEQAAVLIGEDV